MGTLTPTPGVTQNGTASHPAETERAPAGWLVFSAGQGSRSLSHCTLPDFHASYSNTFGNLFVYRKVLPSRKIEAACGRARRRPRSHTNQSCHSVNRGPLHLYVFYRNTRPRELTLGPLPRPWKRPGHRAGPGSLKPRERGRDAAPHRRSKRKASLNLTFKKDLIPSG